MSHFTIDRYLDLILNVPATVLRVAFEAGFRAASNDASGAPAVSAAWEEWLEQIYSRSKRKRARRNP